MDTTILIVLPVVFVVVVAVAWFGFRAGRRSRLEDTFGPEYLRTRDRSSSRRKAERDLLERRRRRDELHIRPLSDARREHYRQRWADVETRFVDDPDGAAVSADRLVLEVMHERGYPVDDRDHVDVLSVEHPGVVERYRMAMSTAADPRSASTEALRQALLDLRATFDGLVRRGSAAVGDEEGLHVAG